MCVLCFVTGFGKYNAQIVSLIKATVGFRYGTYFRLHVVMDKYLGRLRGARAPKQAFQCRSPARRILRQPRNLCCPYSLKASGHSRNQWNEEEEK
jgi:hypothetical protein